MKKMSWFDEATWTCPICDYTIHGNEPAVHVICENCKKEDVHEYTKGNKINIEEKGENNEDRI